MLKKITIAAAIALTACQYASASSNAAWNALFAKVNGTCIGQSGIDTPEASAPVVFDDATGKIAVMLRGRLGKGAAKKNVSLICLYDKKTGRASIAEYHWLGK